MTATQRLSDLHIDIAVSISSLIRSLRAELRAARQYPAVVRFAEEANVWRRALQAQTNMLRRMQPADRKAVLEHCRRFMRLDHESERRLAA